MTVSVPQRTTLLCANTLLAHAHCSIDTLSMYRRLWYELTLCLQILVELAELQDQEVGDGTTSVVIVAAELLKRANELVRNKIHPTSIIGGYRIAMREVQALTTMLMIISVKLDDQCLCSLLRAWPFDVHMRNLLQPSRMWLLIAGVQVYRRAPLDRHCQPGQRDAAERGQDSNVFQDCGLGV